MSNGDLWTANISYDGSNLTVIITDPAEASSFTAINNYAINLASLLGQNTAYVGFTSGTGGGWENHDIVNWTFANTVQNICTYSLSPGSASPGAGLTTGTLTVTAGTGCAWTATSNATWITITAGASGTGNGTVGYSVAANGGAARTGTLTVGGQTFTVTQAAGGGTSGCSYSVSPTDIHATAVGLSSTLLVFTNSGCAWTTSVPSGVTWITLNPIPAAARGRWAIRLWPIPGAARNTTLTVAGVAVTVEQDGPSSCPTRWAARAAP